MKREGGNIMKLSVEQLVIFLGVVVFLVNVVVEVTKNIKPLDQIHTNYYVTGLSVALTVIGYFAYLGYYKVGFIWYYFIGAIFLGFIAAYLAMFGWESLINLWKKSQKEK